MPQSTEPGARGRGVVLPDDSPHLVPCGLPQRLGVERQGADQQLVENDAERVDIGGRVDVQLGRLGLLGAHVLRRPDEPSLLGEEGLAGERLADRLRHAEVDDLGDGRSFFERDQDVRGLQVAVDDALLVCMLDRPAKPLEHRQPIARAHPLLVAVLVDRNPGDVLHDEVRAPRLRAPGVEHLGDVRVVHQRQRLALALEASDHLLRIHAELDDLDRHAALKRLTLLGEIDAAHASLAQQAENLVGADLAGQLVVVVGHVVGPERRQLIGAQRPVQIAPSLLEGA